MSAPTVSDHALLRFIERSGLAEVEPLRLALGQALRRGHEAARAMSASDHLITVGGHVFLIKGETVVTVMEATTPASKARVLKRGTD